MKRRLPWGVYLALWSFGFLLAASWVPLWRESPEYGTFYGLSPDHDTLWGVILHHEELPPSSGLRMPATPTYHLGYNVRVTLIVLAVGAGAGLLWRWEAAHYETKRL